MFLGMIQFFVGFSVGVFCATEYDFSYYVDASKELVKSIKKKEK